ncbi:MAG: YtxH domain-containing protein [Actinomycetes bacterium]
MRTKATFLAGFATGYVLGARAGRARYEQIRSAARAFASNPMVQSTASSLQHQAGDALSSAKDRAADSLSSTLQDKRPGWLGGHHESGSQTSMGSNGHRG